MAELCQRLREKLGLIFGCIDLVVTPDGEYVFLEINEMGQFLFVEQATGLPLLDAFSELLIQARPDFVFDPRSPGLRYDDVLEAVRTWYETPSPEHVTPPQNFWPEDPERAR